MRKFVLIILSVIFVATPFFGSNAAAFSVTDWSGSSAVPAAIHSTDYRLNSTASSSSLATPTTAKTTNPCLRVTNHEYEVCSAYIANSSVAVLVPYYKYAQSSSRDSQSLQQFVTYRLGQRYVEPVYSSIRARVATWPAGAYDVSIPNIKILSVTSSVKTNSATLTTRETWIVKNRSNQIVYQEQNMPHTVIMQRVPSYILHKWVVSDIR